MMNRNILSLITLALLSFSGASAQKQAAADADRNDRSIVILYDNDVHCVTDGYARMAGLRDMIADTAYCSCVSSGDYLQGGTNGAISKGQYVVDVMKQMDYAAITLGNHEFDFGTEHMYKLLSEIGAPVTCANLLDKRTGKSPFPSFIMKEFGLKKVAFVGALTPTTRYTEAYGFVDKDGNEVYELCEDRAYAVIQEAVNKARKAGADYVVILSHLGDDKNALDVDSHGLIANTTGIDVVLDGHAHHVVPQTILKNKEGKSVIITQTGTQFANVGKLLITKDGQLTTELLPMKSLKYLDGNVMRAMDAVNAKIKEQVEAKVFTSDVPLDIYDKDGNRTVRLMECNAGDLVADAYMALTGADMSITNGGGIRTSLKSGELTYGDVIALLPYENYLMMVEVSGQKVIDVLNACTQFLPAENGDFPQVAGLKFNVDRSANPRVSDVQVLDKTSGNYLPIEPQKNYKLATIDYCVTGGGLQNLLQGSTVLQPNIMLYSAALIEYVKTKLNGHIGTEYAQPKGRIIIK